MVTAPGFVGERTHPQVWPESGRFPQAWSESERIWVALSEATKYKSLHLARYGLVSATARHPMVVRFIGASASSFVILLPDTGQAWLAARRVWGLPDEATDYSSFVTADDERQRIVPWPQLAMFEYDGIKWRYVRSSGYDE